MRKSIAILLTLSFILVSISIIGSIFLFYKKITNNYFEYSITEDSFIIRSIEQKMKKINIKTKNDLFKLLLSTYEMKINDFVIYVSFQSAYNKININRYLLNNKINASMDIFMNMICDKYKLKKCEFFKDLILDTLDTDKIERISKSEIILYKPFLNGYIYNLRQFKKIINYYKKITGDTNVEKVPWDKIFSFNNIYTDCDNISPQVAYILGVEPSCNDIKNQFSKNFLKKLSIIPFNNKINYFVWINVSYKYYLNKYNLKILYDLKNKRIIKIEKHIIY